MNCADAKHLIHLDVGDDLRTDEEQQLAGHMERCAECRAYHAGMVRAMSVLLSLRGTSSADSLPEPAGNSVWSVVSHEITRRRTTPTANRKFNLRVAALSVCSLSLAVVTIVQSLSSMRASSYATGYMPSTSVSYPMDRPQISGSQELPSGSSRPEFLPAFTQTSPESGPQSF